MPRPMQTVWKSRKVHRNANVRDAGWEKTSPIIAATQTTPLATKTIPSVRQTAFMIAPTRRSP